MNGGNADITLCLSQSLARSRQPHRDWSTAVVSSPVRSSSRPNTDHVPLVAAGAGQDHPCPRWLHRSVATGRNGQHPGARFPLHRRPTHDFDPIHAQPAPAVQMVQVPSRTHCLCRSAAYATAFGAPMVATPDVEAVRRVP